MLRRTTTRLLLLLSALAPAAAAQEEARGIVITSPGLESLTLGGELRARAEVRDPSAPVDGLGSTHPATLRARVNLDAKVDEYLSALVQVQHAVAGAGTPSATDLHQGYLRLSRVLGDYGIQVGRFEQEYGEGRLVAVDDWQLLPNAFDGARVSGAWERLHLTEWNVFLTQAVMGQGAVNPDTDFHGAYLVWDFGPHLLVDTYALRRTSTLPNVDEKTYGLRATGDVLGGLDWSLEAAIQDGEVGTAGSIGAYAWIAHVHYALDGGHHLGAEWSFASGDGNPADRERKSFNAPFPDSHRWNGIADVVAFSNLSDLALRYWLVWNERWTIHAEAHAFFRDETLDRIYPGAGGAGLTSTGDDDTGKELDAWLEGRLSRNLFLTVGGAYFLAGSGIRNEEDQLWGFGQLELRF